MYNVCGQCMPCRITKRKEWETRLMLEWQTWGSGAFVTLTYAPEHLPESTKHKGGNLVKEHAQLWLKRFRQAFNRKYGKTKIRHFLVGEYGEQSERAHYHVLIFNATPEQIQWITDQTWKMGHNSVSPIKQNRIKYTIGYTIKKLTDKKKYPDGRQPEFSIMSRKPGIGYYTVETFAEALRKKRLIPMRAFSLHERMILRNNFLREGMQGWSGVYYQNQVHFRLNNLFLRKITAKAYPEIMNFIKINTQGMPTAKELKAIKIYNNRLTDHTLLDKIKFETEDLINVQKQSEKKTRETQKKNRSKKI